jgi:flagellar hook-length control protein FliK
MSDRLDEHYYRNAVRAKEIRYKDLGEQRLRINFANKMVALAKQQQPHYMQSVQKSDQSPKQDLASQNASEKRQSETELRPEEDSTPRKNSEKEQKKPESKANKNTLKDSDSFLLYAASQGSADAAHVKETPKAPGPSLPQPVINELVDRIYSSRNARGHKMITINLKPGVLGGAHIEVSVNQGQVNISFSSSDNKTKALLRNSEDAIQTRLSEKKLSLSDFVVH